MMAKDVNGNVWQNRISIPLGDIPIHSHVDGAFRRGVCSHMCSEALLKPHVRQKGRGSRRENVE